MKTPTLVPHKMEERSILAIDPYQMSRSLDCPPLHWRGFNSAADLVNLLKLAGMTRIELAALSGFNRHAVAYHTKRSGRIDGVAPRRFREAFERLGIRVPDFREPPVPAPQSGPKGHAHAATGRCGAKTRKGSPCQCKPLRNGRCKFHGGLSTGPKTPEGKARIAEGRRARAERERGRFSDQYAQARAGASWA
jgi:hypothetical protein